MTGVSGWTLGSASGCGQLVLGVRVVDGVGLMISLKSGCGLLVLGCVWLMSGADNTTEKWVWSLSLGELGVVDGLG